MNPVPPRGLCHMRTHCCCCCRSRVTPPPADAFKRPSTGPTTTSRSLPRPATAGSSFRSVDYFLYTPTEQNALGYLIWCKHMPVELKTEVRFGCKSVCVGGGGGAPMVKFAVATKPISFLFKKSKSDTFSLWGDSTLTSISLSARPVSPALIPVRSCGHRQ